MFDYIDISTPNFNRRPEFTLDAKYKHEKYYVGLVPVGKCPYIMINGKTWKEYCGSKKKKFWYNIRRSEKFLNNEIGECDFSSYNDPNELTEILPRVIKLIRLRWPNSSSPIVQVEFNELVKILLDIAEQGKIEVSCYENDGKIISCSIAFIVDSKYYLYSHAINPDYKNKKYSVGKVFFSKLIRTVFERQFEVFDFMIGSEPYKFEWTRDYRTAYRLILVDRNLINLPYFMAMYLVEYSLYKIKQNKVVRKIFKKPVII